MKRTLIIWGAGRIGRGFVADIFQNPEYRIVFVDADRALTDLLNERKSYSIYKATASGIQKTTISGGFTAVHTADTQALRALFLEKNLLLDIAVHAPKLEEVSDMLAPLFAYRAQHAPALPMDVMMNVNMSSPDKRFSMLTAQRLNGSALEYFNSSVGITGIFAMCISPLTPERYLKDDPLALWNNGFPEQAIDVNRLKCPPPKLARLRLTSDVEREETRKLYTLNMAHALLCYLGLKMHLKTSSEAAAHPILRPILEGALMEASLGLTGEYGFSKEEMAEWRQTILRLLENPYIQDDLQRLGADTRRKLSAYDRLVGPARLCVKHGGRPVNLASAIRAGFDYRNDDEGTRAVRQYTAEYGPKESAKKFCMLSEGDGIFELLQP